MEAIILTVALAATPYTTCEIVFGDDRNSQVLFSEYNRKNWSLGCLAHECSIAYDIRWTHRIDVMYRGETPAVFVGSRKLGVVKARASGDALISLHGMLSEDAKECRELMDDGRFNFTHIWGDDIDGMPFKQWTDKGELVPAPPAEEADE